MKEKHMKQTAKTFAIETGVNGATGIVAFAASRTISKQISKNSKNLWLESVLSWGLFGIYTMGAYFVKNKSVKSGLIAGGFIQGFMATGSYFAKKSGNESAKNYFLGSESDLLDSNTVKVSREDLEKVINDRASQLAHAQLTAMQNKAELGRLLDDTSSSQTEDQTEEQPENESSLGEDLGSEFFAGLEGESELGEELGDELGEDHYEELFNNN